MLLGTTSINYFRNGSRVQLAPDRLTSTNCHPVQYRPSDRTMTLKRRATHLAPAAYAHLKE
jgi:hypothetical protein